MKSIRRISGSVLLLIGISAGAVLAQSPSGPVTPKPGTKIQLPPQQPKIVSRVELVNTPVTVRDNSGHMVHDLEAKDFQITDNGIEQKIAHFDLGGDPLSLVIVVETSSRVAPLLPEIRKSGILFSQAVMGDDGEAAIVGFNDSVDKLQGFTTNQDRIENTVSKLQAGGSGAKLYDAMAIGVEMLSGEPQPTADAPGRRRVMLVLSEAKDVGSESKLGAVLRQAQLSNVTIYTVGLSTTRAEMQAPPQVATPPSATPPGTFGMPPMPGTPQTPTTEEARYGYGNLMNAVAWAVEHVKDKIKDQPLELSAAATGGASLATFKNHSIENALDEIGGELHSQYSLTYQPTGTSKMGYHEIRVAVVGKEAKTLKVRARPGYYLAVPES